MGSDGVGFKEEKDIRTALEIVVRLGCCFCDPEVVLEVKVKWGPEVVLETHHDLLHHCAVMGLRLVGWGLWRGRGLLRPWCAGV